MICTKAMGVGVRRREGLKTYISYMIETVMPFAPKC